MLSKTVWSVAAAGAGLCFIGYCIYFDRKRRSDPMFRSKLREKRRRAREAAAKGQKEVQSQIPDLKDPEAMQRFFLQEVQLGEELLATGDIENGVEHLSNAVAVCGRAQQLLQVLQQTLPPQVFQLLLAKLPVASQRIALSTGLSMGVGGHGMSEDDIE